MRDWMCGGGKVRQLVIVEAILLPSKYICLLGNIYT